MIYSRTDITLDFQELIVKFGEGIILDDERDNDGQTVIRANGEPLPEFYELLGQFEGAAAYRSFRSRPDLLAKMTGLASETFDNFPSLESFARVRLPRLKDVDPRELQEAFANTGEIEYVTSAALPGPPPLTTAEASDIFLDQVSIAGARTMNNQQPNGAQVTICVCEYGFNQQHVDLPNPVSVLFNCDNLLNIEADHGTMTLGVLGAQPNAFGVTGICPAATLKFASTSGIQAFPNTFATTHLDSLPAAWEKLEAGDIVLLEMQARAPDPALPEKVNLVPWEYNEDVRAAIKALYAKEIIVIAAAGNGRRFLDDEVNGLGQPIWHPDPDIADDSMAILVGAGTSTDHPFPHSKRFSSNYGTRVNCQAWGHRVVTTGGGDLADNGPDDLYTDSHNGTSAAAAIVTGIAACLQGAIKADGRNPSASFRNARIAG